MTETTAGRVSDDGLWAWDGRQWVHPAELQVECPTCRSRVAVREDGKSFKCPSKHEFDFIVCSTCRGTTLRPRERRDFGVRCAYCGTATQMPGRCSVWGWAADQHSRGQWPPGRADSGDRRVAGLTLAAAAGSQLRVGDSCVIDFIEPGIRIASSSQAEDFAYASIRSIEVTEGPGRSQSERNRDLAGGGVIGMLTGPSATATRLHIATASSEYVFTSGQHNAAALRVLLLPVDMRVRHAQAAVAPQAEGSTSSLADELGKLAQLRDAGVLSDAEFASAKARLLGV